MAHDGPHVELLDLDAVSDDGRLLTLVERLPRRVESRGQPACVLLGLRQGGAEWQDADTLRTAPLLALPRRREPSSSAPGNRGELTCASMSRASA